jgi:hypothetical protein
LSTIFDLEQTNQLSLLPDKDLVDLCPPIEPYQVTKNQKSSFESTAKTDREEKKEIYQNTFRTPDYFWFDPYSLEFEGYTLIRGKYQPIEPNQQGWLWSEELGLYLGIYADKLRYFSPRGQLIPTPEEAALLEKQAKESERQQKELALQQQEYERQQKESERQQKELALQKIEQLTARLRELGINPDETL